MGRISHSGQHALTDNRRGSKLRWIGLSEGDAKASNPERFGVINFLCFWVNIALAQTDPPKTDAPPDQLNNSQDENSPPYRSS